MILPFNLKPALSTYLYSAYPFGIVEPVRIPDAMLNWNIQLAFLSDRNEPNVHKLSLYPALNLAEYSKLGLFEAQIYIQGRIDASTIPNLSSEMARLIGEGYYLLAYVDYFFLPGTDYHNRSHFRHEILIYGVDLEANNFKGALYTKAGVFGAVDIPFDCMVEAFVSSHARDQPGSLYCQSDLLAGYKPKTKALTSRSLDPVAIRSQIEWFLDEKFMYEDFKRLRNSRDKGQNNFVPFKGVSFGRKVYPEILSYYNHFATQSFRHFDIRVPCLLWEHKKLMGIRLERLKRYGWRHIDDIISEWREVEFFAKAIHLQTIAARRQGDAKLVVNIKQALQKLESIETTLLMCLPKAISLL